MPAISSPDGDFLLSVDATDAGSLAEPAVHAGYTIWFVQSGQGVFRSDYGAFPYQAPVLLFATPLQYLALRHETGGLVHEMRFHGDFYCIEFHRNEVACNGLLFNNIYTDPLVLLGETDAVWMEEILDGIAREMGGAEPAAIVLKAYLQLFLAKSGHIKTKQLLNRPAAQVDEQMERFRELLDIHFLDLHKPQDYAALLAMSPNNLSKKCSRYFKKTPSALIQERLVMEAKKLLHLTRKSIKEIAWQLHFEDEFYFSRLFKKFTKVSPQAFRDQTGISIVADLSM
nr:response regulator transcription factor [uncultured Dyadobacter sp.]